MQLGHLPLAPAPPAAAVLAAGQAPLITSEGLEPVLQVAEVLDLLTSEQRGEGGDAQVHAHFAVPAF